MYIHALPARHYLRGGINVDALLHQQQQQQQPFNGRLSGTTRVGRYQKKHSPSHTHPGQRTSFITFLHLQRSTASSLFSLRAWQSSRTTSVQVLFGLPLGLEPSTSYCWCAFNGQIIMASIPRSAVDRRSSVTWRRNGCILKRGRRSQFVLF